MSSQPWTFDDNYDNLEQVAEFLPAFERRLAELTAAGRYRYNDDFRGHVPGIEGPGEDTAIYLLQTLERQCRQDEKVTRYLADGFEPLDSLEAGARFRRVVFYSADLNNYRGGWQEWSDARLIPETNSNQMQATGHIRGVLPKGKRTNGYRCDGRAVLVLR